MSRTLQTNQLVKLRAQTKEGPIEGEGVVLDASGVEVLLAFPDDEHLPAGFAVGARVLLKSWDQLGLHEGPTNIIRHLDNLVMGVGVAVRRPEHHATLQRRASFRVPARLPFTYRVIRARDPKALGSAHSGTTEDVSVGGMRFVTDLPLSVGDDIETTISFTLQTAPITRLGTVLRTAPAFNGTFTVGLQFVESAQTERIIDELYHVQRGPRA